jgi:hypothetical protein
LGLNLILIVILRQKDVTPVQKAKGIIVGMYMIDGLLETNPLPNLDLKQITITNKYGFPDIIYPGTERNDFYFTLDSGEFALDKTMEVEFMIKLRNGEILPVRFKKSFIFSFIIKYQ